MDFAREDNGEALDSDTWYVMADYAFYEGDDPGTSANEGFDPLYPGFQGWGTWWQGEIAGEYFLSNSNLKTHMLQLRLRPSESVSTGLLFFTGRGLYKYAMIYATFSISK